jgi:SAM-dependent methyltransferase
MDPEYGRKYRELFERHWWWRARSALILEVLRRHAPVGGWPAILDIGCGDGLLLGALTEFGVAEGIEPDGALVSAATRAAGRVHIRPFDESFLPATRYNLILVLDVVEHLSDPAAALRHAARLLAPDGRVIITVPAFRALWTAHDDWNHHVTRYTRGSLETVLADSGLAVRECFYFFHWLAPAKLVVRWLESLRRNRPGITGIPPVMVNEALLRFSRLEAKTLTRLGLPFGSSLCCVASA